MSELLKDVDEMMRQERLMTIWRTYGNYIIGGLLAIILAVAVQQAYRYTQDSRAQALTGVLLAGLDSPEPAKALLDYAGDKSGNGAAIARILAAQNLKDKPASARELLLRVRNDATVTMDLRDLSTLVWVRLSSGDDKTEPKALLNALAPLMRDEGQPFAWHARLETAVITANRLKDYKAALDWLAPMTDNLALPYTLSERAQSLAQIYRLRQPEAATKK
jgi:hypothetical protein